MKDRVYVCHTYYHALIAMVKELLLPKEEQGKATLILSKLSNDFGTLDERVKKCGLFEDVIMYDEKEDTFFPELKKYRTDTGNIISNMWNRIIFTKKFGKLLEPDVPVDFKQVMTGHERGGEGRLHAVEHHAAVPARIGPADSLLRERAALEDQLGGLRAEVTGLHLHGRI